MKHSQLSPMIALCFFLFITLSATACNLEQNNKQAHNPPTHTSETDTTQEPIDNTPTELTSPTIIEDIQSTAKTYKTIHIFVALCDNKYQGIVPVPERIGNGQNPAANLYWGCGYGIKHYFDKKTDQWDLVATYKNLDSIILERRLFKHKDSAIYMLADAYDGQWIYNCNEDMLLALSGNLDVKVNHEGQNIAFGGASNLIAYIGHNGLMDFYMDLELESASPGKDCILLACMSKSYYAPFVQAAGARPLVWTTHFMAPEAYTLAWALEGWVLNERPEQIRERAAQAYNHYQKCGIKGARNLLVTGF